MAIDFRLTPRQREIQRLSREFAGDVIAGANCAELLPTAEARFLATKPIYEAIVAAGFLRKCIPAQAGGESDGVVDLAIIAEEFYSTNASVSLTLIGTLLGLFPILLGGTSEQRSRLLISFLKRNGAPLAAFCATEPGGSANAASPRPGEGVRTTAKLAGDCWIIRGSKSWISSASGWDRKGADVLCVLCRTDIADPPERSVSIIAVEHLATGFVLEDAVDAVGHRAHLLPSIRFDDVPVPRSNLVGERGGGFALTAASFIGAAALVGIFAVALMRAAFDFTLHFAKTERRGGIHPAIDYQAVGFALADAKTMIEVTRSLAWVACHAVDEKSPAADELAIQAKIFGSETAVRVITDLMRAVGVDSYDLQCPLGRLLQDALALPIFGGGNIGVRRRQLHAILKRPDYDPLMEKRTALS
jgi:nitroalkane oxidase